MSDVVTDPRTWLSFAFVVVVLAGIMPGALLRLLLLAYPGEHPRRSELLAELRVVDLWRRLIWVAGHIETVWQEAPAARRAALRDRPPTALDRLLARLTDRMVTVPPRRLVVLQVGMVAIPVAIVSVAMASNANPLTSGFGAVMLIAAGLSSALSGLGTRMSGTARRRRKELQAVLQGELTASD